MDSEGSRWPSPTPLSFTPSEDVGRVPQQILRRSELIEKRLENIEKTMAQLRART
jgi:hypothetical protein